MKDPEIGHRFVPIIPDEARTFGLDAFFPTKKIYSPHGQHYLSVDRDLMLSYQEDTAGRAAARRDHRSRLRGLLDRRRNLVRDPRRADDPDLHLLLHVRLPTHRRPAVGGRGPADPRVPARRHRRPHDAQRGGVAAPGRPLAAPGIDEPRLCRLRPGVRLRARPHRAETACAGCTASRIRARTPMSSTTSPSTTNPSRNPPSPTTSTSKESSPGCTCTRRPATDRGPRRADPRLRDRRAVGARGTERCCATEWDVEADVWSVTSWTELRREALATDEWNHLHPDEPQRTPYVTARLLGQRGPVVAVSDWMRAVPDQIAPFVAGDWSSLGTDGFGLSDTRAALRRHFRSTRPPSRCECSSAWRARRRSTRVHRGWPSSATTLTRRPGLLKQVLA